MDNAGKADLRVYVGATGSGKGASVRAHLRDVKPTRLLVWDPLREYGAFCRTVTDDLSQAARVMAAAGPKGPFSIAYFPGSRVANFPDRFDLLCRMAFAAGSLKLLIEEISDVTLANHAPQPWARIVRQGRHRGVHPVVCSQRPAAMDKDTLGNATCVRVFQLNWPADARVMANLLRVPVQQVEALTTLEDDKKTVINYLERLKSTGKTTPGQMILRRK